MGLDWDGSKDSKLSAIDRLLADNKSLVENADLDFLLSKDRLLKATGSDETTQLGYGSCKNFYAPSVPTAEGITRISSLNLGSEKLEQTLLLAEVNTLYASKKSLYLMMPRWWWNLQEKTQDLTYVHKFLLNSKEAPSYVGSGVVDGLILNQFSVSEHGEHFRIATTVTQTTTSADEVTSSVSQQTVNRVSVMRLVEDQLKVVGETQDLAKGERIYSVRFVGSKGYVVTFRQVDPLYTLDLTTPEKPKVLGELKIPGFSSYIHPVDEQFLLTIGRDADADTGRMKGLKISVFDVSDMQNPREVNNITEPTNLWSNAQYDHRAFTYLSSEKLLAIPVSGYAAGRYQSKVLLYQLTENHEVQKFGALDYDGFRQPGLGYSGNQRNIFLVNAEKKVFLYTLGFLGTQLSQIEALQTLSRVSY